MHTLYLCYFWLNEPLVQTQVLPYLRELQKDGIHVSLMTFERDMAHNWTKDQIAAQKHELAAEGIDWYALPYHKWPSVPATVYDVFNGVRLALRIIKKTKVDVLHARVHVPAMIGAIAKRLSRRKTQMIFDIRGFMPEEYTDIGYWKPNGALYKSVKTAERRLFKNSDAFVVLTEKAREILFPESRETGYDKRGRPVEVIPCSIDAARFGQVKNETRLEMRRQLGIEGRRVIAYVGSLGTWYLGKEMFDLFEVAREQDPSVFAMILTKEPIEEIANILAKRGFSESDSFIARLSPDEVPRYLCAADVALSFIKACYSKQSSSPTKIAEYLGCGLPIICNAGVGDIDELIQTERVGAIIRNFTTESYVAALSEIDTLYKQTDLRDHCRATAERRFSLETIGGKRYRNLYRRLNH